MAKVDGLLSYEVYIICVIVSHQPQPQLSHQLLFHISPPPPPRNIGNTSMSIWPSLPVERPISSWTSSRLPVFAGTLLVIKRRTAGCCVPGSPGKMAMSIWASASRGKLDHHWDYWSTKTWSILKRSSWAETFFKNMSHLEISILWHWPMLIQSWRKCRDPLATHKQSILFRVCRK